MFEKQLPLKKATKLFINIIRLLLFTLFIYHLLKQDYSALISIILPFILTFSYNLLYQLFKIKISDLVNASFVFFLLCALYGGNVAGFYSRFIWWDIYLHIYSGVLASLIAVEILTQITPLNKWQVLIFSLVFASAVSCWWEIGEFLSDTLLHTNTQRWQYSSEHVNYLNFGSTVRGPGLVDTMKDICCGVLGGIIGCIIKIFDQKIN